MARSAHWAAAALTMLCLACLPDRLDTPALQAKVEATQAVQVGCGNGKLEDKEQCDDKASGFCGGCVGCQRRRAWHIKDANGLAVVPNTQVKNIDKVLGDSKNGFSVEFWFRSDKLPVKTDKAPAVHTLVAIVVMDSAGKSPGLTMSIARDGDKNAWYPVCIYNLPGPATSQTVAVQGTDPIVAGSWHHLRCALNDKTSKIQMRFDGGKTLESPNALLKLGAKPFFDPQTLGIIGAVPVHKDDLGQIFTGAMDELRVVTGPHAYDFGQLKYRWSGDEPGTQALYHMDIAPGERLLMDAGSNVVHAFSAAVLESQADDCYGFSAEQAQCKATAPWCGK